MIIIVAPRGDKHAIAVGQEIQKRGKSVQLIDPTLYPQHAKLCVRVYQDGPRFKWNDFDLTEAQSIWLRRIGWNHVTAKDSAQTTFCNAQVSSLIHNLRMLPTFWVNSPTTIFEHDGGRGKLMQLADAAACGLTVPDTVVTNDPEEAKRFITTFDKAICKPLRATSNDVFTTRVSADTDLTSIKLAPFVFQEEIPKRCDIRVVLAGGRYLATEIHSQESPYSKVDMRRDITVPHKPHVLPDHVFSMLWDLQNALGLVMGVHDLVQKPDGSYVYLETNQQGEWLWLQERTGQDYVGLVAGLLIERNRYPDPSPASSG